MPLSRLHASIFVRAASSIKLLHISFISRATRSVSSVLLKHLVKIAQYSCTCCGDVPALETPVAVGLLRRHLPELRVRVVNAVDLMTLQLQSEHSRRLSDEDIDPDQKVADAEKPEALRPLDSTRCK